MFIIKNRKLHYLKKSVVEPTHSQLEIFSTTQVILKTSLIELISSKKVIQRIKIILKITRAQLCTPSHAAKKIKILGESLKKIIFTCWEKQLSNSTITADITSLTGYDYHYKTIRKDIILYNLLAILKNTKKLRYTNQKNILNSNYIQNILSALEKSIRTLELEYERIMERVVASHYHINRKKEYNLSYSNHKLCLMTWFHTTHNIPELDTGKLFKIIG